MAVESLTLLEIHGTSRQSSDCICIQAILQSLRELARVNRHVSLVVWANTRLCRR